MKNKTPNTETALQRALTYLANGLDRGDWSTGQRLPAMIALALAAEVSITTMVEAVSRLRKNNKLLVRRGKGIFVPSPSLYRPPLDDNTKWQRLRRKIARDILDRTIIAPGGQLSIADIQSRYGCSYPTVKKAARALVHSGQITQNGNKYTITGAPSRKSHTEIVMIAAGDGLNMVSFFNARIAEFMSHARFACGEAGIVFNRFGIRNDRTNERDLLHFLQASSSLFGIIIYGYGLSPEHTRWLIPYVAQFKVPVAIIDETGKIELTGSLASNHRYKVFTIASRLAGRAIGDFLIARGHRRFAWLSTPPAEREPWSLRRYQGLIEACTDKGLDEQAVIDVCQLPINPAPLHDIEKTALIVRDIGLAVSKIASHIKEVVNEPLLSQTILNLDALRATELQNQKMVPYLNLLCSTALKHASVWVCENDNRAQGLLRFCKAANIAVPATVSIIGFDDSFEASTSNLSTYNFDFSAIARRAVSFIVNPKHEAYLESGQVIECEGHIVERSSTEKKMAILS